MLEVGIQFSVKRLSRLAALAQFVKHFDQRRKIGKRADEPTRMRQRQRAFQHSKRLGLTTLQIVGPRLQSQHLDRLACTVDGFDMLQEVGKKRLRVRHAHLIAPGKQQTSCGDRWVLQEQHQPLHLLLPGHLKPLRGLLHLVL